MTSKSKNVNTDKLADIVNEYNNSYHRIFKMKLVDLKSSTHTDFDLENKDKDSKFEVGDQVRISKYKNIFAKGYASNWSEEVKNTEPWAYVIENLKGGEIVGTFCENELQKTHQTEFRAEKVIKRKGVKLYIKWKRYSNSFKSWIDKNII